MPTVELNRPKLSICGGGISVFPENNYTNRLLDFYTKMFCGTQKNCLIEIVVLSSKNTEIVTLSSEQYVYLFRNKKRYGKTCLKRPLKKRQNKDINDKWQLNEGLKSCRMLQGEHSAILLACIK